MRISDWSSDVCSSDLVTTAMASLRSHPPDAMAGRPVVAFADLLEGRRLPPSDVLICTLDGARLVIRPSGTEPTCKCYAEAVVEVTHAAVPTARAAAKRSDNPRVGKRSVSTCHTRCAP